MHATELTVIDDATSEAKLPDGCPACGGRLDVRLSADGVFTVCVHCHLLGRAHLVKDEDDGVELRLVARARA
ncbi:MAG: hypothetical protein SFW67_00285 [Myxococcaceae bacterium]|nr:hypothetical protein [Myxococcaceae bacterium]